VREPWRVALSVCDAALGRESALPLFSARASESALLFQAVSAGLNAPLTTSMGRLFDAIAALCGIRDTVSFEGQAAIELEQCADETERESYHLSIEWEPNGWIYDWRPVVNGVILDAANGLPTGTISLRFHRALAELLANAAELHRSETGCNRIALSGGCFQNELLLKLGEDQLRARGFTVLLNH
jgi:hydrogenase maturation protein HypF